MKFSINENIYSPERSDESVEKLPSGVYDIVPTMMGLQFHKRVSTSDKILNLPGSEYEVVMKEINNFLSTETRERFRDKGFIYKRNMLLKGKHGTGKTIIANKVAMEVAARGGIVFIDPHPEMLREIFNILDQTNKDDLVMVCFEEFDKWLPKREDQLLLLLDGQIQRDNIIYMATTNHFDKIPERMLRPGRFSSIIEVTFPKPEARYFYIKSKMGELANIEEIVRKTEGFSIDELKEVILANYCLQIELEEVLSKIRSLKGLETEKVVNIR